jgi:hypothetical protein
VLDVVGEPAEGDPPDATEEVETPPVDGVLPVAELEAVAVEVAVTLPAGVLEDGVVAPCCWNGLRARPVSFDWPGVVWTFSAGIGFAGGGVPGEACATGV